MKYFEKIKTKREYLKLSRKIKKGDVFLPEILSFANDKPEYKDEIVKSTLQKLKEQNNAKYVFEIIGGIPEYRELGDSVLMSLNNPFYSCKMIQYGYTSNPNVHFEIVLNSEECDTMLDLSLSIQQQQIDDLNFMLLEDRSIEVMTAKMQLGDWDNCYSNQSKEFADAFYNYVIKSPKSSIKDKIINGILFQSKKFNIQQMDVLYQQYRELINLDQAINFMIYNKTYYADRLKVLWFLDKFEMITDQNIKQQLINLVDKIFNDNLSKVENEAIESKNGYLLIELAKYHDADIEKIQDALLEFGDFNWLYKFALLDKKEADLDKIVNKMIQIRTNTPVYKVKRISPSVISEIMVIHEQYIQDPNDPAEVQLTREQVERELIRRQNNRAKDSQALFNEQTAKIDKILYLKNKRENQIKNKNFFKEESLTR